MLFGLIGETLTHSFSADWFNQKFRQLGLGHTYELFPLESISQLPQLINSHKDLRGLNVTIPYKEQVLQYLDEISEEAAQVGAVNTISIKNGKTKGFNTDVYGFGNSIKPFLEPHHQKALILGTGGASKAVACVFKNLGIDHYFVSRNKEKKRNIIHYNDVNEYMLRHFFLIVNTTPVGMYPHVESFPPIPYEHLNSSHFLVDLVYNPAETLFLKMGKANGAKTMNGIDMLHQQADKAWEIWSKDIKEN